MTRPPKPTPLTASEERILRTTIDDTQVFEVPVKTVKKMLALLDHERAGRAQPTGDEPPVATPVHNLVFVANPSNPDIFCMRASRGGETADDELFADIFTRGDAVRFLRTECADRLFHVPAVSRTSGAHGVVPRVGSEIADLLERGDLP